MSDQIRKLNNKFKIAGKIAELSKYETGETQKGVPYIRVDCAIQYGESAIETKTISYFSQEYSVDDKGNKTKESKVYPKLVEFFENAKNKTIAKVGYEDAAEILAEGSYGINDYVNASGELKSVIQLNGSFANAPDNVEPRYYAQGTLEGYIKSINPEMSRGDDPHETGRLRLELITTSFRGDAIPITLIVTKDNVENIEDNYEAGQTANFFTDYIVNKSSEPKAKKGGFGVKREEIRAYTELVVVGGDAPFDEDDEKYGISKDVIKIILQARKEHLEEIENKGYLGNKTSSSSSSSNTKSAKSVSSAKTKAAAEEVSDDDIPF